MEQIPTYSSRLKRKPLSDRTNSPQNHSNSNLISQTLIKPRKKPSNLAPLTRNTSNQKNNKNPNYNLTGHVVVSNSSVKSGTSTGSNNSPNCNSVHSQPDDIVCKKSGPPATLTQRQGEQIGKDKGKSVGDTTIIEASAYLAPRAIDTSSSALSGNGGHISRPPTVENREKDEQKRKDKGKAVLLETPIVPISVPLTSHTFPTSSSAASGNCYLPLPSSIDVHKQDVRALKCNTVPFGPTTPSLVSSSSVSVCEGTDAKEKTGLIVFSEKRPSRRSSRRKNGAGSISLPFSCPPERKTKKKGVEIDDGGRDGFSGSHTDPLPLHKKKRARSQKHEYVHAMPQDEVQRLKALYADIDAFELVEEVAAETELD